jgi:hypothetical protein
MLVAKNYYTFWKIKYNYTARNKFNKRLNKYLNMKTEDINVILKEFESIESITPSENWDLVFQNKLDSARLSKSKLLK